MMLKLIAQVLAKMNMSEVCWRSRPQELSSSSSLGPNLMEILRVVFVLDGVELEEVLGTHLTKA